jgi:hypothetical protein
VDQGAGLSDVFEGSALDMELLGFFFVFLNGDTFFGLDFSENSFADKVLDFECFLVSVHEQVDGEMGGGASHFKFVTVGHASNHVLHVGVDGGNSAFLLSSGKPHLNYDLSSFLSFGFINISTAMLEGSFKGTQGSGDFHDSGFDFNGD